MATQGTSNLKLVNDQPEVDKLQNGRYRLTFFCTNEGRKTDWYKDKIDRILPSFGTQVDEKFGVGEWSAMHEWSEMVFIEGGLQYVPAASTHYVKLVYESLTDAWVQEVDDTIDYELNGLERLTRVSVAKPNTAYTSVVGTTTITNDGTVLYLGSYKIVETDAKWTLQEIWLERGILNVSKKNESEGVMAVTTVFFGEEGATVGPIIERSTKDYEGFQTISITTLQDSNGDSVVDGGENLVNDFSGFSPFSYPGLLDVYRVATSDGSSARVDIKTILVKAPAQCKVKTRTYVLFQDSNTLADSDYAYAGSGGLWSPNKWASVSLFSSSPSPELFNDSATFRGYRTAGESKTEVLTSANCYITWNGRDLFGSQPTLAYTLTVNQGPPDPIGNTYTLDVKIVPAFDDVDGNQYYKKTIIVTDVIPTQPELASLPYEAAP